MRQKGKQKKVKTNNIQANVPRIAVHKVKPWIKRHGVLGLLVFPAVLALLVSVLKYRSGEINYYNSDATWHVLYTVEAYRETPVSEHLFLPLTSLGSGDDKNIPWGATVLGRNGNYYYTSFSPAGYFLPWLFMKLFSPSVTEGSLYGLNTVLFAVSASLWTWFLYMIYAEEAGKKRAAILAFIGALAYLFSPELLHGMGIVYWHQSIMQVTLLIQMIAYYKKVISGSKRAELVFYLFTLLNPYIEWTGYVANVGFALAELIRNWRGDRRGGFAKAYAIGAFTLTSFGIFTFHYLLRVDAGVFFSALKARFFARNITTSTALTDVYGGYLKSFLYLWVLLLILIVWNFVQNKKITMYKGILILVLAFPILENSIMKEHAVSYTYDRMKFIFLLAFLICELSNTLLSSIGEKKVPQIVLLSLVICTCGLNLKSYLNNTAYIWEVNYRDNNKILADYINEKYSDSVMAVEEWGVVRGYLNLLFGRGIYEGVNAEQCCQLSMEKGKRYAVIIRTDMTTIPWNWNLCPIKSVDVYDVNTNSKDSFYVLDGMIWSESGNV